MFEYKSETRTGSKPVSATGNEMRITLAGSAAGADAAISRMAAAPAQRSILRMHTPKDEKSARNVTFPAGNSLKRMLARSTIRPADRCIACTHPLRMMKPHYWAEATFALSARDAVLARWIAAYPGRHLTSRGDPFTTLTRAIGGQQISLKAAQTIWERL